MGNISIGYIAELQDGTVYLVADMDVIYNVGDAINKIGFGLVVYIAVIHQNKQQLHNTVCITYKIKRGLRSSFLFLNNWCLLKS